MGDGLELGKNYVGTTLGTLRLALSNIELHYNVNSKSAVFVDADGRLIINNLCGSEVILDIASGAIISG